MSQYLFIVAFLEGCHACVNFKTRKNQSGKTSLEELRQGIASLGLEMKEILINNKPEFNHDFYDLKGMWFPSFYLMNKHDWSMGHANGYVLAGEIENGSIKQVGQITTNPDKVLEWVKSILNPQVSNQSSFQNTLSNDTYFQYEPRLMQLKSFRTQGF